MVGTDGTTRITDFGVAKAEVRMSSTRDGQFKGKLAYMAPEQAASGHADQRSDLFGMAVVLWESLVGRRLFKAENNAELLNRLLYLPIPPPSEYIPELTPLDALLAKALEREPDKRFQSAPEFIEAIEEAAAGIGGLAPARGVGRAVKEYLGTKIEREAGRIREAMESLGRSEVPNTSVPRPENSSLTPSAQSLVRPKGDSNTGSHRSLPSNDPEASTKLEKLTKQEPIAQPSGGRNRLIVGSLIGATAIGVAAYFAMQTGEEDTRLPPLSPAPVVETPAPAVVVPPSTPTPTPPTLPPETAAEVPQAAPPEETTPAETPEETRTEGRHRRTGHGTSRPTPPSTGTGGSVTTPATTPPPPPDDDEVIVNPYAR
jgi:serine/threonine-protein kinase